MEVSIGRKGKIIIRLEPGEELIESIFKAYEENGLKNAIIINCIGSLKKITYVFAIEDSIKPLGFRYCDPIQEEGIFEFLSAQGNICRNTEGKLLHHIHTIFGDSTGKIKGGHLLEKSNIVLATMEIILEEMNDLNMIRAMDDIVKAPVLKLI